VTLLVASCGFLMVSLDVTIVNVALPTLARQLGASLQQLQWIVDGYALMYAAVLITGGGLGDIVGSRRVFMAGLGLFSAASAACGLAPSTEALIAARFECGSGLADPARRRSLACIGPTAKARSTVYSRLSLCTSGCRSASPRSSLIQTTQRREEPAMSVGFLILA
jgi:MFS transporter, DHA2 family, methylenomycin A resistance protein